MGVSTSKPTKVSYVDSGASNHMTNHKEWFSTLNKPEQPSIVETGDDSLSHVSQRGIMRNVLHVPIITKNLVSVKKIVDQGIQVWFTHHRCFIKEEGWIIAQGRRDVRMFILHTKDICTFMFSKGQKVKSDITSGTSGSAT